MRNIIVSVKTEGHIVRKKIDLYDLILKGEPIDFKLKEGEVIYVPPIGKVAAIAGAVRRPAIYELKGNETIQDLIKMAGGILPSAYKNQVILNRYTEHKEIKLFIGNLNDKKFLNEKLKNGDLIIIKKIYNVPTNFVELKGEIKYPGKYPYFKGLKLSDLLTYDLFKLDTNLFYAEIDRRNPTTLNLEKVIKFKPIEVLQGKKDFVLKPYDIIVFYPKYFYTPIRISGCVKNPRYIPFYPGLTLQEALSNIKYCTDVKRLKAVIIRQKNYNNTIFLNKSNKSLKNFFNNNTKINFSNEHFGNVTKFNKSFLSWGNFTYTGFLNKGGYKIFETYLYDLLVKKNAQVNIPLKPGDKILIEKVAKNEIVEKVYVFGYVKNPGVFSITDKTTLYDILKRAGGFRKDAYPAGIVILRDSVAKMQKKLLSKAILEMQKTLQKEKSGILQAELSSTQLKARQAAIEAQEKLLSLMEETEVTGRITGLEVPKDLNKLKNSSSNILLEDDDRIYIPKKPSEVLIFGEVYNPSALVYHPGMTVKDYIDKAGGFTKYADIENIFIIKPNGSAFSLNKGFKYITWDPTSKKFIIGAGILSYKPKPGEAIIVPTKIRVPIMWKPLIKDVIQILYQSA